MAWTVTVHPKVAKRIPRLPQRIREVLELLLRELEARGPMRGNWSNYSKLSDTRHHCHLIKRGRPTYVAVWEEENGRQQLVEVIYVGTREKAPY